MNRFNEGKFDAVVIGAGHAGCEAALALAYEQLAVKLSDLSDGVQILSKEITTTITDAALVLECKVECIENIARQVEFEIVESNAF